jgi:hypothetical protein
MSRSVETLSARPRIRPTIMLSGSLPLEFPMTLGIQRGLTSSAPLAEQRRADVSGADAVSKTRAVEAQTGNAVDAAAAAVTTPKADAATVQGARERALGVEDSFRQRLESGGWVDAHHRKGHIGTRS